MVKRALYSVNQSPFYRLNSKRKLAELLGFEMADFTKLVDDSNYHHFLNKNGREIQHPINELDPIHNRIAKLLARLDLPDYLHSCKGRSYVSNAAAHMSDVPLIKTDISKFYPSTSFSSVFNLFHESFYCSRDVAWHLARLCCYKGRHLPTGSYLSGIIAFLAHRPMFDEIFELSCRVGCTMTCYVDDIVLSGNQATKTLLYEVCGIITRHGLAAKRDKSKTFPANKPKIVTGVVISSDGLAVPNKRLQDAQRVRNLIMNTSDLKEIDRLRSSLRGKLQEAKQIYSFALTKEK
jgi:hypothetical protein